MRTATEITWQINNRCIGFMLMRPAIEVLLDIRQLLIEIRDLLAQQRLTR